MPPSPNVAVRVGATGVGSSGVGRDLSLMALAEKAGHGRPSGSIPLYGRAQPKRIAASRPIKAEFIRLEGETAHLVLAFGGMLLLDLSRHASSRAHCF